MTTTSPPPRLPVTVVTGFLGAGKTTLLRHLLRHGGQRLAVLVNEFGEVGIDGDLIAGCGFCPPEEREERVVELANGCLCCTVQEEFLPTMEKLLERADRLDGIVVETSGLALPEPLVAAFGWPAIRTRTRVHGVVTVVDGEALAAGHVVGDPAAVEGQRRADPSLDHLTALEDLFEDQLRAADLVLVSRADCLSEETLGELLTSLEGRLRPGTPVLPMARGVVDPQLLLAGDAPGREPPQTPAHDEHEPHHHSHAAVRAVVVQREGTWERRALEQFLQDLLRQHPVLRLKGRLRQSDKRLPLQIQAVGSRLDCWYEAGDPAAPPGPALELVALAAEADAPALEQAFTHL